MENATSVNPADQMLREIQSESLQQLLTSVKHNTKPPGSTAIRSLDSYLSWSTGAPDVSSLESAGTIQIQGHRGSGKTHLLYFLVATCVMPTTHLSEFIGGWNKAAFVVDMGGHFQISRFRDILINRLQPLLPPQSMTPVLERCLKSIHVFCPSSSEQLSATLAHMPKYHTKHFPDVELGMVAVHSIDSFYWLDRFKAEQLRSNSSSTTVASQCIPSLEGLRLSYGFITVLTRWGLPQPTQGISNSNRDQQSINQTRLAETLNTSSDPTTVFLTPRISVTAISIEDAPHSGEIQWLAQAFGKPQPCIFTCQIKDNGVVIK